MRLGATVAEVGLLMRSWRSQLLMGRVQGIPLTEDGVQGPITFKHMQMRGRVAKVGGKCPHGRCVGTEVGKLDASSAMVADHEDESVEVRVRLEIGCDFEIRLEQSPEPNVADGLVSCVEEDVVRREWFVVVDVPG